MSADTICGGCGETIAARAPALFIPLPGVKRERIRCQKCEGDAPPDLPELASDSTAPPLEGMIPMRKLTKEFGGKIWKRG